MKRSIVTSRVATNAVIAPLVREILGEKNTPRWQATYRRIVQDQHARNLAAIVLALIVEANPTAEQIATCIAHVAPLVAVNLDEMRGVFKDN